MARACYYIYYIEYISLQGVVSMMRIKAVILTLIVLIPVPAQSKEISGINIAEQAQLADQPLTLNGAGVRTKFVFDIYVGALYLKQTTPDAGLAIQMAGPKRVLMHFLYDAVEKEKLTDGWSEGFENNLTEKQLQSLKPRLDHFNSLFISVKNGDEILLDYVPDKGTSVIINKNLKGTVAGEDFNRALLRVWLGEDPADSDLKSAMLGG